MRSPGAWWELAWVLWPTIGGLLSVVWLAPVTWASIEVVITLTDSQVPEMSVLPVAIHLCIVGIWLLTGFQAVRRKLKRRVLRAYRLCCACGYSLVGSPPSAMHGCVVCPECGAAWRVGDGKARLG